MRLDWLHRLTDHQGPFATVVTDASRDGEDADRTVELRGRAHAERLTALGAPDEVVQALAPVVSSPTRRGGGVGRHGRSYCPAHTCVNAACAWAGGASYRGLKTVTKR